MRTLTTLLLAGSIAAAQDFALARAAARIDTEIKWMTDGFYATDPGGPVQKLPKTDVDRMKLLDDALKRAGDEESFVFWYIPRIEGGHMVRPEFLDTYMRCVAFTDEWLPPLINSWFVPLRMAVDGPIAKRTGITKLDWVEPAIVILDAHGNMLHRMDRIRTFDADSFRRTLKRILVAYHGKPLVKPPIEPSDTDFRLREWKYATGTGDDDGALKAAAWMSGQPDRGSSRISAWGSYLTAITKRMAGDAAAARESLDRAEKSVGDDKELKPLILTERGRLALHTGDLTQAQALLADAATNGANPRRSEAMYLLGITKILSREMAEAESLFRDVVELCGDKPDRWAARAAVNLLKGRDTTPVGPAFHGFEDPTWTSETLVAESRTSTAWPRRPQDLDAAVKQAVAWLLRHQGDEGGYEDSRYAYCDSPRILPNVWVAITAVALAGLNDWRDVDPKAIDEAIARGEGYLFDETRLAPGRNEECYADTFRLVYLSRRLARMPQGSEDATRLRSLLNRIAKRLVAQQTESGNWAHEYKNPFCTAAALHALKLAQDAGAAVPSSALELGRDAIRRTRGEKGAFAYSAGRPAGSDSGAFKNAMPRMPICERALAIGAKDTDLAPLEFAVDNFWEWLPRFERIRVCDYHSDGELAGFMFWHGMFLTSEAIKALPGEKRAAHEKKMLEHVMSIGEMDGSFVDSHELGKSYGTGMALMVLKNSTVRRE